MIARAPTLLILSFAALSLTRCAFPHGSLARPVQPVGAKAEGASEPATSFTFSGGAMIPFAAAAGGSAGDSTVAGAGTADAVFVIPHTSFNYAIDEGFYFGLEMSSWTSLFLSSDPGSDILFIFLNPNFEIPLDEPNRRLSLTIDANIGYLRSRTSNGTGTSPFFAPTIGIRWYIPVSTGGLILSQQFGTGIISIALPGSLAFDIPISLGESKLHIFPEVRWDPTLIFLGGVNINWVFFSGGLSFMLEV